VCYHESDLRILEHILQLLYPIIVLAKILPKNVAYFLERVVLIMTRDQFRVSFELGLINCHQVAAQVPDTFLHKFGIFRNKKNGLAKSENARILLKNISHIFPVTTNLFTG
jgi:hypothetical protein